MFLATGLGTSVGLNVGTGKVLSIQGQALFKDTTTPTKVGVFSMDQIPAATTVDLKFPAAGGTIATTTVLAATVQAAHPTGTVLQGYYGNTPPTGYIFVDGRTIGNVGSGATNRAAADCLRLFTHLWGMSTIQPSKGANAAADWTALRRLVLPNHSGRVMAGRDNLSGTAAGILTGFTSLAVIGGQQTESAAVTGTCSVNSVSVSGTINFNTGTAFGGTHVFAGGGGGDATGYDHQHNLSATLNSSGTGSGTISGATAAVTNVQPTIAIDVIIAL